MARPITATQAAREAKRQAWKAIVKRTKEARAEIRAFIDGRKRKTKTR